MSSKFNRSLKLICLFSLIFSSIFMLSGCKEVNKFKVKLGVKNDDFEYIKSGKVDKVVIQNSRDTSFRFIVSDKKVIEDIYDILSSAKKVSTKTELNPDYIFEMYTDDNKVYKFNYVAELDKNESGNFYNDDKIYMVSKRIDNDIIKSFWNIRRPPTNFEYIYYESILESLREFRKDNNAQGKNIGIIIDDDLECARFMLSLHIAEFKDKLLKENDLNANLINKDEKDKYDIIATVKTEGYKTNLYKSSITLWDKKDKIETKFYVWSDLINNRWNIKITDSRPKDF